MAHVYESSWLYGGSIIFPETITITKKTVTWEKKCGFFGLFSEKVTVPRSHIYSVASTEHFLGGTIRITFRGANSFDTFLMEGQHFDNDEIEDMKEILM